MSWQVKDEATEITKLKNDLNKIRDQLFISNFATGLPAGFLVGGASGQGSPLGAGSATGLFAYQVDRNVQITDVDFAGVSTGVFDKIQISTSSMIITTGGGSNDVKFILGSLNDGQFIILKPETGTTKTLKPGGNINISSDVTITDKEFVIAIFYEEQTSPDANGNYVIHKLGAGVATSFYQTIQDEGSALTQRPTFNFTGVGVTATDDVGNNRTNIDIPGAVSAPDTPWTVPHDANGFSLSNLLRLTQSGGIVSSVGFIQIRNNFSIGWKNIGAGNNTFRNDTNDNFNMAFNGVTGYTFSSTQMNLQGTKSIANINNIQSIANIFNLGDINTMTNLLFDTLGFAFTNSRQVGGTSTGLFVNTPTGQQFDVAFNGQGEWKFTNQNLTGQNALSSIVLNSFFLLFPQASPPFINGELRTVGIDLLAFSGNAVFNFTKSNPLGMGVDLNFQNTTGFTIDFDANNVALTATAGFATLPSNPLTFIIVKLGGVIVKIPAYSP